MLCINQHATKQAILLEYTRYVELQDRLRKRRRELLLFCQHPPTLTAGIQSKPENLLFSPQELSKQGIAHIHVRRGGDYTAHEPGQCVIYPHIDLRRRKIFVHDYLQILLETTVKAMEQVWQIHCKQNIQRPGLYCLNNGAKIAAIACLLKGFFTSFGLAINISNSMEAFKMIHACGFQNQAISSVESLGRDLSKLNDFINVWQDGFFEALRSLPRY